MKPKIDENTDIIVSNKPMNLTIMKIFTKLFQRVQREVQETMAIKKLKEVPRLKFVSRSQGHAEFGKNPRKSLKRRALLYKVSDGNIQEDKFQEEGYNKESNKIVFGLNEREHELMLLICTLMRTDKSRKFKAILLEDKQLEEFISFYRQQDVPFYEIRGLDFNYFKQEVTNEVKQKFPNKKQS